MTKQELLLQLQVTGEINRQSYNSLWVEAFKQYTEATKDKEVNMQCGGCYRKVKNWLLK